MIVVLGVSASLTFQTYLKEQDCAVSGFGEDRGSTQLAVTAVTFKPHPSAPAHFLG